MSKQGHQPHGGGSRDGVEEPLEPLSVQEAFARCVHVAGCREGLAEVGLCRFPPGCWWDLHPQKTSPKAAVLLWGQTMLGHARRTLRSPGYSLTRHQLLFSSCPVLLLSQGGIRQCQALSWERGRFPGPAPWLEGRCVGQQLPGSPSPQNQAAAHTKLQRDHIAAA